MGRRIVDQLDLTGHATRASDIDRIASLGVTAVRYPVLWGRVVARGVAAADWSWPDQRLGMLQAKGIRPVVGLVHHSSGPRGMSILHSGFAAAFARYAGAFAARYPWVEQYIPVNEPLTTARFGGLYGVWQPHARSEAVASQMLLAQCHAIKLATRAIHSVNPRAQIIVNEDVGRNFFTPEMAAQAALYNERRWLTWDLLLGRVTREHPLYERLARSRAMRRTLSELADDPSPPDILGIDHYLTSDRFLDHRLERYREWPGLVAHPQFVDVEAVRISEVPAGSIARAIDDTWRRYRLPMALTEISLAGDELDQVAWWNEAWQSAAAARASGSDIRAVTAWAVFGAYDWHCLLQRNEGVYEPGCFDVRMRPITRRRVADAVARSALAAAASGPPRRPGGSSRRRQAVPDGGWWSRSDRFLV